MMLITQNKTFSQSTVLSKLYHLQEEIQELITDLQSANPNRRFEFAYCIILLFGAACDDGMTYDIICRAIQEKFEINKNRKWGIPNKNGVVNHIE